MNASDPAPRALARALALLPALAAPALAQNDRIIDTPTGWGYLYGATSTDIANQIAAGMRPFAFEPLGSSAAYDAIFIHNSGPYAVSGTLMTYSHTAASLASWLSANGRRILDLEVFDSGGSPVMHAITLPNSGPTAAIGWQWRQGQTFAQIVAWLDANPTLRLIDLDVYTVAGVRYYSGVAVPNTGANAQGWWYYSGATAADITHSLTANDARLIDIEVESVSLVSPTTFACVMVSSNPGGGWWYPALTTTQVADLLSQNGARLTCLRRYTNSLGQDRWAVAMVDNANPQTRRIRDLIRAATDGTSGFMLKQVGGPTLASLHEHHIWEPASTIKLLHAVYAIDRCADNQDGLAWNVDYRNLCASCPFTWTCSLQTRPLSVALRGMLEPSDNYDLVALENRYGYTTLNAFADANGFPNLFTIRRDCECRTPTNGATCADLCTMMERVADGTLFNQSWRDILFDHMNDLAGQGWSLYPTLSALINQEAAQTSLTTAEINSFRAAVRFANKGGLYDCGGLYDKTEGGWASLPFMVNIVGGWVVVPREYTFALFVNSATNGPGSNVIYSAKEEILREQVREALQSWDAACETPAIQSHPAGRNAAPGDAVLFTVSPQPNPAPITYRWYRGANPLTDGPTGTGSSISGSAAASLLIGNVGPADAGAYSCRLSTYCGSTFSNAATLTITAPLCYPNCDNSTAIPILNVADFSCFLQRYAAADPWANCDQSTTPPVLNVADFSCFLQKYAAGCP